MPRPAAIPVASNQVRDSRERRGLPQLALAAEVGLSRQSLGAIEAGRARPSVDVAMRLASALGSTVESLFGTPPPERTIRAHPSGELRERRVALAHVGRRVVAYGLDERCAGLSADGLVQGGRGSNVEVAPLRPDEEVRANLVVMGCAPALGLLAERLNLHAGLGRTLWFPRSNAAALASLAKGETHVAGVHAPVDPAGRRARTAAHRHLVAVTLGRWEMGLLHRRDDARVRSVADLARRGVRLAVREPGAGARTLLERRVRDAGLGASALRSASLVAGGHLEVARAIAQGAADAGVATRDAALLAGLAFVPWQEERFDLVADRSLVAAARFQRLADALASAPFRRELDALGYDTREAGAVRPWAGAA